MLETAVAKARDASQLNNLCYQVAEEGMALDQALAACDASLKLRPDDAATLDSRAFVLMRMGRNAEALVAYDAALAKKPDLFAALYGRSLVETRLGRTAEGARDSALALGKPALPPERDSSAWVSTDLRLDWLEQRIRRAHERPFSADSHSRKGSENGALKNAL